MLRTSQRSAAPVAGGLARVADWVEGSVVAGVLARLARGLAREGNRGRHLWVVSDTDALRGRAASSTTRGVSHIEN